MEHTFTVVLLYEQDGRYVARVPALGCASLGSTSSEAFRRVKEALLLYVAALEAQGQPIPTDPFDPDTFCLDTGDAQVVAAYRVTVSWWGTTLVATEDKVDLPGVQFETPPQAKR